MVAAAHVLVCSWLRWTDWFIFKRFVVSRVFLWCSIGYMLAGWTCQRAKPITLLNGAVFCPDMHRSWIVSMLRTIIEFCKNPSYESRLCILVYGKACIVCWEQTQTPNNDGLSRWGVKNLRSYAQLCFGSSSGSLACLCVRLHKRIENFGNGSMRHSLVYLWPLLFGNTQTRFIRPCLCAFLYSDVAMMAMKLGAF